MKGTLAFTGLLPNSVGRVAFFSENNAVSDAQAAQLFHTFCHAWQAKYHLSLMENHRAVFQWEDINTVQYPLLNVDIKFLENNKVKFTYVTEDSKEESVVAENTAAPSVSAYIVSAHHQAQLLQKKQNIYQHVNPDKPLPEISDRAAQIKMLQQSKALTCVDKVMASIEADALYPVVMKSFSSQHKAVLAKAQDDEGCQAIKAALIKELRTEKAGYQDIQQYLNRSFFPYMKQSAVVYLFLDHMVHFLCTTETQELYRIVEPWLQEYRKKYFSSVSGEAKKQGIQRYVPYVSEETDKYVSQYVEQFSIQMQPFMDICGVMSGSDSSTSYVHCQQKNEMTSIVVDNGYHLNFKSNDLFELMRDDKALKAISALSTKSVFCDGKTTDEFSQAKNSYTATINDIDIAAEFSAVPGIAKLPLSVEEKISLLVSAWVLQSDFQSSDSADMIHKKCEFFSKKVKTFLNYYCSENKESYHERDFKEMIAFYVARNGLTEHGFVLSKKNRLTLEHRKAMVKAIYDNKLPDSNHNVNDTDYSVHIEGSTKESRLLEDDQAYIMEYEASLRPKIVFSEDQKKSHELANYVQIIAEASFMSSNGNVGPGYDQDDKRDQTHSFARLETRKKALIALMFREVVKVAEDKYPQPQTIVKKSFVPLDALINDPALRHAMSQQQEKNSSPASSPDRVKPRLSRNVSLENEMQSKELILSHIPQVKRSTFQSKILFQNDFEEDKKKAVERSKFTFEKIDELTSLVEKLKATVPEADTRRAGIVSDVMVQNFNGMISAIENSQGAYILNESSRPAFMKACNDISKKIKHKIAAIPDELEEETNRRIEFYTNEMTEIVTKMQRVKNSMEAEGLNDASLLKNLIDEKNQIFKSRESYYQGMLSDDDVVLQLNTFKAKIDSSVTNEKMKLQQKQEEKKREINRLKQERKNYRIDEIKSVEVRMKDIKDQYFADVSLTEDANENETPESMTGSVFGKDVLSTLEKQHTDMAQTILLYQDANGADQVAVDDKINAQIKALDEFERKLKQGSEKAVAFKEINAAMHQYANASLITHQALILSNYTVLKNEINTRSFFQRFFAALGVGIGARRDREFAHAKCQVAVLSVMLFGDEHGSVTHESLKNLNDLTTLKKRLQDVSNQIVALQSFWFPPKNKIAIFCEARRKLEEQIVKVILQNKVKAVCAAKNIVQRNALVEHLSDDIDGFMQKHQSKGIASFMAKYLPNANEVLQKFKDTWNSIFCIKESETLKEMEPLKQEYNEVVITQFVSPALLLSRVQVEVSHSQVKNVAGMK